MEWRVGDDALCVRGGYIAGSSILPEYPTVGKCHKVVEVEWSGDWQEIFLVLAGAPINGDGRPIWAAERFVKVTPDTEDAFDREVIEALKSEPVHVPQHAALHNSCQCEVLTCADAEQVRQ